MDSIHPRLWTPSPRRTGVKAPLIFSIQNLCKTPVSRTQRSRIVSDGVKGEAFKVRLTDRSGVPACCWGCSRHEQPYQPPQHGPDPCKDAVPWSRSSRSLLLNMKPTNGYLLCLFWVGFSKKHTNSSEKQPAPSAAGPLNLQDDQSMVSQ